MYFVIAEHGAGVAALAESVIGRERGGRRTYYKSTDLSRMKGEVLPCTSSSLSMGLGLLPLPRVCGLGGGGGGEKDVL